MHLVHIEETFRALKSDLGLRSIYHQLDHRIEAHIFLSYCFYITLEKYNKATGLRRGYGDYGRPQFECLKKTKVGCKSAEELEW
jgi:hypothetical protein